MLYYQIVCLYASLERKLLDEFPLNALQTFQLDQNAREEVLKSFEIDPLFGPKTPNNWILLFITVSTILIKFD